jgi:hypothetical protein
MRAGAAEDIIGMCIELQAASRATAARGARRRKGRTVFSRNASEWMNVWPGRFIPREPLIG